MKKSLLKSIPNKFLYRLTLDDGRRVNVLRYFGQKITLRKKDYYTLRKLISCIPWIVRNENKYILRQIEKDIYLILITTDNQIFNHIYGSPAKYVLTNIRTYICPDGLLLKIPLDPDYLPF